MTSPLRRGAPGQRLLACMVALAATLVAAPGHAIDIPAVPLQSGSAYPPANIRFILDDSGSMAWDFMPGAFSPAEVPTTSPINIGLRTSSRNTLYYDPATTYQAWRKSDKSRMTGGTSFDAAYTSDTLLQGSVDLDDRNETFYVLNQKGDPSLTSDYTRYRFLANGTVEKAGYNKNGSTSSPLSKTNQSKSQGNWLYFGPITTTLATDQILVTVSGGNGDPDLYVMRGDKPTRSAYDCASENNGPSETCTFLDPVAGDYYIGLYAYTGFSGVNITVQTASGYWTKSVGNGTPTGRTASAERTNFATWYSYYRTRSKVAKAGAGEAFSNMGSNVRVGFDTIWNRNEFAIPVGTSNGVFTGTNRDTWYSRLYAATADNGTPLHRALRRAGEAIKDTSATGPWGPETGTNQLSCRQNFTILTTDGYWNSKVDADAVGNIDNENGPTVTNSKGKTFTYAAANPYKDARSSTLADVAMQYWKNDLVSDLENNVPTSTADPAFWQHMVTFGVSIGQQGTLTPNASTLQAITNGTQAWPNPLPNEDATRIDDLWHASVNGHGSFVAASDPTEFIQGLLNALKTVEERLGSASNVTANSTSFVGATYVYQASYVSGKWTGELAAYSASSTGVSSTPFWKAGSQISPGRTVYTWSGTGGTTFPTSPQVTALDQSARSLSPVSGSDNADYIKGVTSKEERYPNGVLRNRTSLLGDIVNSSPMYLSENDTIFVGANDGMLHAFNASTGAEVFAYLPGSLNFSDLASLSDPQYTHKYFVDGPVVVSTKAQTSGDNYLIGALGRGGKGVFALKVTKPSTFGSNDVLWESAAKLTSTQQQDMGQVLGEPLIVTLNDTDKTKAVIVANGINSSNGHAVLFVFNLATGALIQRLDTGAGSDNGLSAPRGWDDNGDGTVDYVYAGDLKGNLWKFDFTGATASIGVGGNPLFKTASGQPITTGLALARDPATSKRWIFVGTGKFLENGDVNDQTVQSMYGLVDDGSASASLTRSDLQERTIVVAKTVDGRDVRGFEAHDSFDSSKKGWYIDLDNPTAGERIISRPQVKGGVLITASIIPPTNNSCEAGGSGYINALDAFSGTSLSSPYFDSNGDGKVDDSDKVTDSKGTEVPVGSIDLGVGMPTLPTVIDKLLVVGGSTGALGSVTVNPQGGAAQRISWREILRD